MKRYQLQLRAESIRVLTSLADVFGGHPTSNNTGCFCALRATVSEAGGGGPCPGEYSWTCKP